MAAATGTFGFIRQLSTSISVVIGGVVFQNGMEKQHDRLVEQLGAENASFLTGASAASSVGEIAKFPPEQRQIARDAYFNALRTMYIVYVAFSAFGLFISLFVGSRTLSKDHEEHKTGLDNMKKAKKDAAAERREQAPADEEKASST